MNTVVKKSLITQQDIAFGEDTITQQRGAGTFELDKVRSFYPVNSLVELYALDTNKFKKAILIANSSYLVYAYLETGWTVLYSEASRKTVVETLLDLRQIKPDYLHQHFDLLGHTVSGIGGGTLYYTGEVSDATSEDNFFTFVGYVNGIYYQYKRINYAKPYIEMAGAIGDSIVDDSLAFKRAANVLGKNQDAICWLRNTCYRVEQQVKVDNSVIFQGEVLFDVENARGITRPNHGTWITYSTDITLFLFADNNNKGAGLRDIAIFQEGHTAPGLGWTPTVKPWTIICQNTQGTIILDRVHLHNVYLGIFTDFVFRPLYGNITGQFFKQAMSYDRIYDIGRLDGLHQWTYWSEHENVIQYMQANLAVLQLFRVDGLFAQDVFTFGAAIGVLTEESTYGGAARVIDITSLYCDFTGRALVINSTSPSYVSIGTIFHLGQAWPATPLAALPAACGISIDQGSNHTVQVGNYTSTVCDNASVKVFGTNNQVWIGSEIIESYDMSGSGNGAHHVAVSNSVKLGSKPSLNKFGGGTPALTTAVSAGVVQAPLIQQTTGANNTNEVIASAGAPGQLAVLTTQGEANAGIALLASGAGTVSIGSALNLLSFYAGPAAAKGTITGSRAGNAAVASMATYGADRGLWTDGTTP